MGRVAGKVAFVTGAARGQGRAEALRLAEEGADIIAVDIAGPVEGMERFYEGSTEDDLAETVRQVEALDRRIVARKADVRDFPALKAAVDEGVAELGRLDIVVANAGIFMFGDPSHEMSGEDWDTVQNVNLKGVWQTAKAALPHLLEQGEGGSIVLTSSTAGHKGFATISSYTAAKHGVIGLMKVLANEYGQQGIRVNTVHPTSVRTPMVLNEPLYRLFNPEAEEATYESAEDAFYAMHLLPIPLVDPIDIANAVLFLASDEARYVTGLELKVDGGFAIK
ncbi:MAG: mycofactocin-coupled SDR family oxidoreductase [Gordonia sp. (in: high G+C Gram-positive bacteria)]